MYVADGNNKTIKMFTNNLQLIKSWGGYGSGNGQFKHPIGVAVDSSTHEVYVTDIVNHRIQKFTKNGLFITKWGDFGSGNGQFNEPYAVAIDPSTHEMYVADTRNNRIQKFLLANPCPISTIQIISGVCFVTMWGSQGSGNGQFENLYGVAVDFSSNVYVADTGNHRIEKFTKNGVFISKWP